MVLWKTIKFCQFFVDWLPLNRTYKMFRMSKPGLSGIMTSRDLPSFNLSDVFTIQSSVRPMSHVTSKYDHESWPDQIVSLKNSICAKTNRNSFRNILWFFRVRESYGKFYKKIKVSFSHSDLKWPKVTRNN